MAALDPQTLSILSFLSIAATTFLLVVLFAARQNKNKAETRANQLSLEAAKLAAQLESKAQELSQYRVERENEFLSLQQQIAKLNEENRQLSEQRASLSQELANERKSSEEKLTLLADSKEKLSAEFKLLANEIFESKNRQFTEVSKTSLQNILTPLRENLQRFEKKVEDSYNQEARERFSLGKEIGKLKELNDRISEDAVNLTNALKGDNKAQGNWGELVLESILEKSGLVKGREYEVQVSLKADDGSRSQPDVIIRLPEGRDIIIDSKVSLKAWDAYCSADEEDARNIALQQHVQSIRNHVKSLSAKDYQKLNDIKTLDYVLLFMPIEAAYSVAAQEDPELFQFAFEKNIIIVVPPTLLTTLRTVQNIWQLVQQNENAIEIAQQGGALYDKFVAFLKDFEEVGARIEATHKSYDKARNKLHSGRGNLIARTEKLKKLGVKASKQINKDSIERGQLADEKSHALDQLNDENTATPIEQSD